VNLFISLDGVGLTVLARRQWQNFSPPTDFSDTTNLPLVLSRNYEKKLMLTRIRLSDTASTDWQRSLIQYR